MGEEGSPKKVKASEISLTLTVKESHRNTKIPNHNIYAEDICQIHVGSLIVTSVSVNPYAHRLFDSVSLALVVSMIPLAPTILPPPTEAGFPKFCLMFGCVSLHLLLAVAE